MATPAQLHEPDWPAEWLGTVSTCLWCGASVGAPYIRGVRDWFFDAVPGQFDFARCADCASLVLLSRPRADHIGKAYQSYYTHAEEIAASGRQGPVQRLGRKLAQGYASKRYGGSRAVADKVTAALFRRFGVRRAEVDAQYRYLPEAAAEVLDYGCGNGDFLARAASLGHIVTGVDFDPAAAAVARRRGLTIFEPAKVPDADFASQFDHVTAAHVIEHVADPAALLRDFHRWLRPGGTLFLEFPNAQAAGLGLHGRFWRGLEAPRHFSIPSEQGLRQVLDGIGFQPLVIGRRAFARQFMDAASSAAARAHGGEVGAPFAQVSGPEMLTCLARAE